MKRWQPSAWGNQLKPLNLTKGRLMKIISKGKVKRIAFLLVAVTIIGGCVPKDHIIQFGG